MTDLLWWIIFEVVLPFIFYRLFKNPSRPELPWGTKLLYILLALITFINLLISLLGLGGALPGLMMIQTLTKKDWIPELYLLLLPIFNGVMLFIIPRQISSQAISSVMGMVISANLPIWIALVSIVSYSPINTESATAFVIYAFCFCCFVLSLWLWIWWEKLSRA